MSKGYSISIMCTADKDKDITKLLDSFKKQIKKQGFNDQVFIMNVTSF